MDLEIFAKGQSDGTFSIDKILDIIQNDSDLFGDSTSRINLLTANTGSYEKSKISLEFRLFQSIETNSKLKPMSEFMSDPENPAVKIRRLYVFCRGAPTANKRKILNSCLIQFSLNFVKLPYVGKVFQSKLEFAQAQYQPNVCSKDFRTMFSDFKRHGIVFSLAKDFCGTGNYP